MTSTSESSDWSSWNSPTTCSSSSAEPTKNIFLNKVGPNSLGKESFSKSGPYIKILEQPQSHVRFRYGTEGDHSYLYGEHTTEVLATYPTVQLVNYKGAAHLRCELFQWNRDEKHPYQLKFHKQERQIDYFVPVNGSYTAYFEKLRIISIKRTAYSKELRAQYLEANPGAKEKDVNKHCKKKIDFNRVRLRFSAHDVQTDEEICHVYSTAILDSSHPETNKLHIDRVSKTKGPASGSGEIWLLVKKISNQHTKVRFREAEGEWSAIAHPVYKHHQLAIVCSIPPYKNENITHDVDAIIELFRETDGTTSNPIPFQYIGRPRAAPQARRRAAAAAAAAPEKSDQNTMETSNKKFKKSIWAPQLCDVPVSQQCWSTDSEITVPETTEQLTSPNDQKADSTGQSSDTDSGIQETNCLPIYSDEEILSLFEDNQLDALMQCPSTALLPEEIKLPEHLVEEEDLPILHGNPVLTEAVQMLSFTARPTVTQPDEIEAFSHFYQNLPIEEYFGPNCINDKPPFQELIPDSAQRRECKDFEFETIEFQSMRPRTLKIKERPDVLKTQHTTGKIVEMEKINELIQDIIIVIKQNGPKSKLKTKLATLFELDLPKGDTFLHITLDRRIFSPLVKILHAVNMTYVLNEVNDLYQTVLHLAVINELAEAVRLLVSKGCDPMLLDADGNNAIHLAVPSLPTLAALFDAMAANKVLYDVNATNYENLTALHLATIKGCEPSLRLLLEYGADVRARDTWGRTALHLAACHGRAGTLSVLLDHMDAGDVDATDCRGRTALQSACESDDVTKKTLAIIQLLLEAKADPTKCADDTVSAMKLARRHPEMRQIIQRYQRMSRLDESEDEYYTADEEENLDCISSKLQGLIINRNE